MSQVFLVKAVDLRQVLEELLLAGGRQHGDAVLLSLAVPHDDLVALEVDVLDAHAPALEQAQPAAVEEGAHEQRGRRDSPLATCPMGSDAGSAPGTRARGLS